MSTSAGFWHRLRTAWPFARSAPETPDGSTGGLMNNNDDDDHRETRPLLRMLDAGMLEIEGREGGVGGWVGI